MTTACPIDYAYQDAKQMAFFLAKPIAFKPIYDEIARRRGFPFTIGHRVLFGLGSGARLSVVALLAFAQQAARLESLKEQPAEWCHRYSRAYWLMLTTQAEDLLDATDDLSRCQQNVRSLLPIALNTGHHLRLASFGEDAAHLLVTRLKVRRDTDFQTLIRRLSSPFWRVSFEEDEQRRRVRNSLEAAWPTLTEPMPAFRTT